MASLFLLGSKSWDVERVQQIFRVGDANAILSIIVPQRDVKDGLAWNKTSDGIYSAKTVYILWYDDQNGIS